MIRLITLILIIVICFCLYYKLNKKQERFQVENTFLKLIELKNKSLKVHEQTLPQSEIDRVSLRLNNFFSNL